MQFIEAAYYINKGNVKLMGGSLKFRDLEIYLGTAIIYL